MISSEISFDLKNSQSSSVVKQCKSVEDAIFMHTRLIYLYTHTHLRSAPAAYVYETSRC